MSGLVRDIYTKKDDGSSSDWELWDRKGCYKGSLYSAGVPYVKVIRKRKKWALLYRLNYDNLDLHLSLSSYYNTQEEVLEAVLQFADWAFRNQISLVAAHSRSCE